MLIKATGEICSIGYQNPTTYSGTYEMKVFNTRSMQTISQTFSFSQSAMQYQSFSTPLFVNTGVTVVVSRTITSGYPNLSSTIGRMYQKTTPITFPVVVNPFATITGTNFVGAGGPVTDFGIPIIGLGFKVN